MHTFGKLLHISCVVLWLLLAISCVEKPAYAYVDPGSGLFLTQILTSMTVGLTFLVRKRIRSLFAIFSKPRKSADVKEVV